MGAGVWSSVPDVLVVMGYNAAAPMALVHFALIVLPDFTPTASPNFAPDVLPR
jgi:hypothetical protein